MYSFRKKIYFDNMRIRGKGILKFRKVYQKIQLKYTFKPQCQEDSYKYNNIVSVPPLNYYDIVTEYN